MKNTKVIFLLAGFALLTISAILFVVNNELTKNNIANIPEVKDDTITAITTSSIFEDEKQQHCGSSDAKSNRYIQEFEISTPCSQPLSIITDSKDNIWFTQTNTGNLAMFEPISKTFTEYPNNKWTLEKTSMMWGIVYTPDDEIWFTDEANGSLWRFSIPEKTYSKFTIGEQTKKVFPQKIEFYDDHFLINDFTGNQIIILNHNELDKEKETYSYITIPDGFFTSQAVVDSDGNMWYVIWKYQKEAILMKTNFITHETERFSLPSGINAPNGISIGVSGDIWIADTASSSFYRFTPKDKQITEFVTSSAPIWTYGNSSGLIKTPITRPYWNAFDSDGKMWFNQQTANRLAVFDPNLESLIEYDIPSKNPKWADCGDLNDCGTSQNLGFTIKNEQVWFTEWVENNIGVLDTTIMIPVLLDIEQDEIQVKQGEQKELFVTVIPQTDQKINLTLSSATNSKLIKINTNTEPTLISKQTLQIPVTITVDEKLDKGYYKILLSVQLPDVSVSSYATIKVI